MNLCQLIHANDVNAVERLLAHDALAATRKYEMVEHGSGRIYSAVPLNEAICTHNHQITDLLLSYECDPRAQDGLGYRAYESCVKAHSPLLPRLLDLLNMSEFGNIVNTPNSLGNTLLGMAVAWGNPEHVQILLDRGADVQATDSKGSNF